MQIQKNYKKNNNYQYLFIKIAEQQTEPEAPESSSSDGEVEIKEEPAEVLVISSSEDEKPDLNELQKGKTLYLKSPTRIQSVSVDYYGLNLLLRGNPC